MSGPHPVDDALPPVAARKPWLSPRMQTLLRIAVSLGLLAFLLSRIDFRESWQVVRQARPDLLLALLAVFFFERFFAAYRWHVLLKARCPDVSYATTVRITFVSNFVGSFLPGAVGIEAIRIYGLAKSSCKLAEAFTSVFLDRLLGMVSLLLMVLVGLSLTTRHLPDVIAWLAWAGLAGLIVMGAMLLSGRMRRLIDRLTPRFAARFIGDRLHRVYESIDAYQRQRGLMALGLVLAVLMQLLRVFGTVIAARALRIDTPVLDFVIFMPLAMFLVMIPISIGGWGVREMSFQGLFAFAGMAPEAAIVLGMLIGISDPITTLPGAWFYARGFARPAKQDQPLGAKQ